MSRRWLLFYIGLLSVGCAGGGDSRPNIRDELGGVFLSGLGTPSPAITLERDGEQLVRLGLAGLQLGTVDAVSDEVNYDPWPLVAEVIPGGFTPPAGLWFHELENLSLTESNRDQLQLDLFYPEGLRASLSVARTGAGSFRFVWKPQPANKVAYFRLWLVADSQEGFYGLGGVLDSVNHRGKRRAMQTELELSTESANNEAHVPVPLLIGTRGWAVFVDSYLPGAFEVAAERADVVSITYGTGTFSEAGLVFYLFSAPHPLDLLRPYFETTGWPIPPAPWALGPWIWRDENESQQQVMDDVDTIRALDLATSAIWIDRPYASGVNSFDFDPQKFPDPATMIAHIRESGLRLALWHTPYLDEEDAATAALLSEAKAKGYFPPRTGLIANNWSAPIDFTNPEAYAWWQGLIGRYTDMGIEGYKLDYAEDVVLGLAGARNVWNFHDGSDERSMHTLYQLLYHRVYAETLPEDGGFLLCRAGGHRDQSLARVIWPGDLDAELASHKEPVQKNGESYVAVGGLRASLIYGLSLSASGYPFYGSDTGGYRHAPPDKECFTRWFEQTALSTVMQVGTNTNDVPWEFKPENGFDEEMLGWYRVYARLHLRLFPYLWTYSQRLREDGRPIARPLGLAHPELGEHPDDIYLLGEELLVAPVCERGVRSRSVLLPAGEWVHFWSGERHSGPGNVEVEAPLGELPLFQRAGSIVPLLRPTIDTLAPTTKPQEIDSFATQPGPLWARIIAAGSEAVFELYDGTDFSARERGKAIEASVRPGTHFHQQGWVLEFTSCGLSPAVKVSADGAALSAVAALEGAESGFLYQPGSGGTLWVKLTPGEHRVLIERE